MFIRLATVLVHIAVLAKTLSRGTAITTDSLLLYVAALIYKNYPAKPAKA